MFYLASYLIHYFVIYLLSLFFLICTSVSIIHIDYKIYDVIYVVKSFQSRDLKRKVSGDKKHSHLVKTKERQEEASI